MDYVLTITQFREELLIVELEQEINSMRWRGEFTPSGTAPAPKNRRCAACDRRPCGDLVRM
jgi:hypothetical protein